MKILIKIPKEGIHRTYVARFGAAIAKRDGGWFCHYCKIPLKRGGPQMIRKLRKSSLGLATVDHVVGRGRGGSNDLDNLVLCCAQCNDLKNSAFGDDYAAYKKYCESSKKSRKKRKRKRL